MFNSVALDVVIGLIFIYLLYSLLATVISEIIVTNFNLRARNLKSAVKRMLTDENEPDRNWLLLIANVFITRLKSLLRFLFWKRKKNPVLDDFYNHPEIKYLGKGGLFGNPSSFKAFSFSKTLLQIITENKPASSELISTRLENLVRISRIPKNDENNGTLSQKKYFDPETAEYLHGLWQEAGYDTEKFKLQLENWFERTMEQTTEWYKRKIQVLLLIIGLVIATLFNADSFEIVGKLSTDKEARKQMVEMATAYIESHPAPTTPDEKQRYDQKTLDSLMALKHELQKDINNANEILGAGSSLPDSIPVILLIDTAAYRGWKEDSTKTSGTQLFYEKMPNHVAESDYSRKGDSITIERVDTARFFLLVPDTSSFNSYLRAYSVPDTNNGKKTNPSPLPRADTLNCMRNYISMVSSRKKIYLDSTTIESLFPFFYSPANHNKVLVGYHHFSLWNKVCYLWTLFCKHFWGYLVTAIAISLGAPFWFDLLNKLMRLRVSPKQEDKASGTLTSSSQTDKPTPMVNVNIPNKGSEEAVG